MRYTSYHINTTHTNYWMINKNDNYIQINKIRTCKSYNYIICNVRAKHIKICIYLACVEQLKNLNPSSIVMKLILVRLDLKLKSTTAVSSVLVISHYTILIINHYTHTITSITELFYNKGIVTS